MFVESGSSRGDLEESGGDQAQRFVEATAPVPALKVGATESDCSIRFVFSQTSTPYVFVQVNGVLCASSSIDPIQQQWL